MNAEATDISRILELPYELRAMSIRLEPAATQREAERRAVNLLIRAMFGTDATLGHRPDGSPVLHGLPRPVEISVSHTRHHAFVAAHGTVRIGIDAEEPRDQLQRVAPRFLSASELELWRTPELLLRAWTIKEAVYKAAATPGLPLAGIQLPQPYGPAPHVAAVPDGRRFRLYSRHLGRHTVTVALPLPENTLQ